MKKNNVTVKIIIAMVIFCLLYILLAFQTLSTEFHLTPEWTIDIASAEATNTTEELIPFRLGQNIGYFTETGVVAAHIPYPFKATISDKFYATYGTDSSSVDFYSATGEMAGTIDAAGYPFFDSSRIFIMLPGGNAFAKCSDNGALEWKFESYAPITAFSSSENGTVVGLADGAVISFDNDGRQTQNFSPDGSGVPVILGAAISQDGKTLALVSGQNQQRFVVVQKNDDGPSKVIFHEYLEKDFNSQVYVKFDGDGKTIYYNYNGGLGIVNLEKLTSKHVPLDGRIIQIEAIGDSWLNAVLSKKNGTYTVTVIEPEDHPIAQFSFDSECAFIQTKGDKLFVGKDSKISCLKVSRK